MSRIPDIPREAAQLTPEQRAVRRAEKKAANRAASDARQLAADIERASKEADRKAARDVVLAAAAPLPVPVSPAPGIPAGIRPEDAAVFQAILEPLRFKARDFVANFHTAGRVATEAARRAGYSPKTAKAIAHKIMKRPDVQKAIHDIDALMAKATAFTFDDLSRELREASAFARETGNASALMKGIELLGKHHGHLTDRVDVRSDNRVLIVVPNRMTVADDYK